MGEALIRRKSYSDGYAVGDIRYTTTALSSSKYLLCDGSAVSLTDYPELEGILECGTEWTAMTGPIGSGYGDLIYAAGIWIRTGYEGDCYYSTDGKSWNSISGTSTGNNTRSVNAIAYGANASGTNMWVAGGSEGYCYYSTNGTTFTKMSSLPKDDLKDIAYGNGMWVGVSWRNGSIYYSTDGTSWRKATVPTNHNYFASVAYGANASGTNMWVAVGDFGYTYSSTSGITWTAMTGISPVLIEDDDGTAYDSTVHLYTVAYGNGRWIAVGSTGSYYSTNGTSWTQMSTSNRGIYVAYVNDRFMTGSYYSTNGTSWTAMTGNTTAANSIAYGGGRWIKVCPYGHSYYSTNGTSWTAMSGIPNTSSNYNLINVVYADDVKKWVTTARYGHSYYLDADLTYLPDLTTTTLYAYIKVSN